MRRQRRRLLAPDPAVQDEALHLRQPGVGEVVVRAVAVASKVKADVRTRG